MTHFLDDTEREQFFDSARRQAQQDFENDSKNAQALIRWGGALLELAHYRQGHESIQLIEQAIAKLEEALAVQPGDKDAEWCLGNAHTSLGFLCSNRKKADEQFQKASEAFTQCLKKDPNNETYKKAIEMCERAPEYYDEIQSQLKVSGAAMGDDLGAAKEAGGGEFWWDVAGWVTLGILIAGAVAVARSGPK